MSSNRSPDPETRAALANTRAIVWNGTDDPETIEFEKEFKEYPRAWETLCGFMRYFITCAKLNDPNRSEDIMVNLAVTLNNVNVYDIWSAIRIIVEEIKKISPDPPDLTEIFTRNSAKKVDNMVLSCKCTDFGIETRLYMLIRELYSPYPRELRRQAAEVPDHLKKKCPECDKPMTLFYGCHSPSCMHFMADLRPTECDVCKPANIHVEAPQSPEKASGGVLSTLREAAEEMDDIQWLPMERQLTTMSDAPPRVDWGFSNTILLPPKTFK